MKNLGVYVHIPFCLSRCTYCDFTSSVLDDESKVNTYIEHVLKEIDLLRENGAFDDAVIDTVYFGGGTPSLLKSDYFRSISARILLNRSEKPSEVTIEANPATIDMDKLLAYKQAGINRISIGVQSLNDKSLKAINRRHSASDALSIIEMANLTDLSISVDLMIGLPYQTKDDVKYFVDEVSKFKNVNHISVYMLTVEDGTKLAKQLDDGEIEIADDDAKIDLFNYAQSLLNDKGYIRYEISNFARPGFEAKHNMKYWKRDDYVGVGLSAHSLINNVRYYNPSDFKSYYEALDNNRLPRLIEAELTESDIEEEYIMLAFRTNDGLNFEDYRAKFNKDFMTEHKNAVDLNKKYLNITDKNISIKQEYLNVVNQIIVDFI